MRPDIKLFQAEGIHISASNRAKRKLTLEKIEEKGLSCRKVLELSEKEPALYSLTLSKIFDASKIPKSVQHEIAMKTKLTLDRKIGTLHSGKSRNKKEKLFNLLEKDYEPEEGWPWTKKFNSL